MSKCELKALQESRTQDPNVPFPTARSSRRALLAANMVQHSPINKTNPGNQDKSGLISTSGEDTLTQTQLSYIGTGLPQVPTSVHPGTPSNATSADTPDLLTHYHLLPNLKLKR